MEPNKEIGISDDVGVEQPAKVSQAIEKHESSENNMQKFMSPQNGGQLDAANPNSTPNQLYQFRDDERN